MLLCTCGAGCRADTVTAILLTYHAALRARCLSNAHMQQTERRYRYVLGFVAAHTVYVFAWVLCRVSCAQLLVQVSVVGTAVANMHAVAVACLVQ